MPTRKIADLPDSVLKPCYHPEHNPPSMIVYEPGVWEHKCPGCGHVVEFSVVRPTMGSANRGSEQACVTRRPGDE